MRNIAKFVFGKDKPNGYIMLGEIYYTYVKGLPLQPQYRIYGNSNQSSRYFVIRHDGYVYNVVCGISTFEDCPRIYISMKQNEIWMDIKLDYNMSINISTNICNNSTNITNITSPHDELANLFSSIINGKKSDYWSCVYLLQLRRNVSYVT
jgi:hypothetical protein